ncbi:MAG: hypothetical protein ACE5LB_00185 [Acidiferrobacterales bacterium]
MSSEVLDLVKKSITEQRCAAIRYYDGDGVRVVEPHAAYTNERGEVVVDCYQTGGFSASGRRPPFWKRMRVKKIVHMSILEDTFQPRLTDGFDPTKSRYQKGVVAIVGGGKPCFLYSPEALKEMGPFLPEDRKYH